MGSLMGHVTTGLGLFIIGLWHLFNQIKLHSLHPKSYTSFPWFPTSRIKYLELYSIMAGTLMFVSMELFIGPARHQPLDPDGTIPSTHLRSFEHSNISLAFFAYAFLSILLDKVNPPSKQGLTNLLGAAAFGQELLLTHLHSTDHASLEGQYHRLIQIVVFASFASTLLGVKYSGSFLNSFVRSMSVLFQGVWLVVMGVMLWTPRLVPKGCFINLEGSGRTMVRCRGEDELRRAKSLVNILFAWYVVWMMIFGVTFYLFVFRLYSSEKMMIKYRSLPKSMIILQNDDDEIESCDEEAVEMVVLMKYSLANRRLNNNKTKLK